MKKNKLFISHSTQGLLNIDRSFSIKEHLYSMLKDDWDVFLDSESIQVGDKWRTEILTNLAEAQAGIILFNKKAALESKWVSDEALIMCFRKAVDPSFQLIPVLLDGQNLEDTCFKKYERFQLHEIAHLSDDNPSISVKDFAEKITSQLYINESNKYKTNTWSLKVSGLLRHVNKDILNHVADKLNLHLPEKKYSTEDYMEILRNAISESIRYKSPLPDFDSFKELITVFDILINQLNTDDQKKFRDVILTKWVENDSIEIILCASRNPKELGVLILNTNIQEETQQYLNRIKLEYIKSDIKSSVHTFSVSAAYNDEEGKKAQIEREISRNIMHGWHYMKDSKKMLLPDAVEKHLTDNKSIAICALPSVYADSSLLKELRGLYPNIIFLLQVDSQVEETSIPGIDNAILLKPLLDDNKHNALTDLYICLEQSIDNYNFH